MNYEWNLLSINIEIAMWSMWSECDPECGIARTRFRGRESFSGVKYNQVEECPNRLDDDCPIFENKQMKIDLPFTNDELKFYAFYLLTSVIGVLGLALIMYLSQIISTPKFVGAQKREVEKMKTLRSIAKQRFSMWKVEQLQNQMKQ